MSKMDNLRAMREARYEQAAARAAQSTQPRRQPAAAPPVAPPPVAETQAPAEAQAPAGGPPAEGLCGHRAISGRTCTREQGHAAKSHRYS